MEKLTSNKPRMSRSLGTAYPHYKKGLKKPWEARWWIKVEGKTRSRSKFFESEKKRDAYIRSHNKTREKTGSHVYEKNPEQILKFLEAREIDPDADPIEVYKFWRENKLVNHFGIDLKKSVKEYLEFKKEKVSQEYYEQISISVTRMSNDIGVTMLEAVTDEVAQAYVDRRLKKVVVLTVITELKGIKAYFNRMVRTKKIPENPFNNVETPEHIPDEPGLLPIHDAELFFRWLEYYNPSVAGLCACTAFAGMRPSAVKRMKEADIDDEGILQPAKNMKKKKRHYVTGLPGNVFEWLDLIEPDAYEWTIEAFRKRRVRAVRNFEKLIRASGSETAFKKVCQRIPLDQIERFRKLFNALLVEIQESCGLEPADEVSWKLPKNCFRHGDVLPVSVPSEVRVFGNC